LALIRNAILFQHSHAALPDSVSASTAMFFTRRIAIIVGAVGSQRIGFFADVSE
jgi:hypothetical protein